MTTDPANGRATIREVYEIVSRIEEKLDARLSRVEQRVAVLVFAVGAVGAMLGLRVVGFLP